MTDNSVCERNTVLTAMAGKAHGEQNTHGSWFTVCKKTDSMSAFTMQQ